MLTDVALIAFRTFCGLVWDRLSRIASVSPGNQIINLMIDLDNSTPTGHPRSVGGGGGGLEVFPSR